MSGPKSRAHFECSRLNKTTFVIKENDSYEEYPFIYVKLYDHPPLVVISDTGCGGLITEGVDAHDRQLHGLRGFIETVPVLSNGNEPLNPLFGTSGPAKKYLIVCTHCHYDHILGIEAFQDSHIIASGYDKAFVEENLFEHSLCKYIPIQVPSYQVSTWAKDLEWIKFDSQDLRLRILHTPGHTPDELAWYDEVERHIYIGDTAYERVAKDKSYEQSIIFPKEGDLIKYMQTLDKMLDFVGKRNAEPDKVPVKIGCGHVTASTDAIQFLLNVQRLFQSIIAGNVPIVKSEHKRGEEFVTWREDGEPKFSVAAPVRLVEEIRKGPRLLPDVR